MRPRFVPRLAVLAALLAALALAGCGGGGGSSEKEPAEAAPPDASVFIEATIRPDDEVAENVDSLAQQVAGIDNVGEFVAEELESAAAGEGEELDFEKEVEPWLGEKAGIFMREYDGEDFQAIGAVLQVEDEAEAEEFIDRHVGEGEEELEEGSFEGVDFKSSEGGTTFGFTEGLLLFGQSEANFKEAVEALDGENLESTDAFSEAIDEAPDGAAGEVFVDIGGLIEEAGQGIDSETQLGFEVLGIELEGSTALISLVPGSDQLEMDVSSNVSTGATAGGDASALLGSLPAGSVAGLATAEYGKALQQMVDRIDANGIPGQIPPHEFKKALEQSGFDLESLLGSIGDIAVFAEGNSERNLGGALLIETKNASEAQNTIKNLSLLLRASGTPGVTTLNSGGLAGFSVRSDEIGPKPLIVAVGGDRIIVSYGLKAATAALSEKAGTLADDPAFTEAQAALGDTPISAFVDGPSALNLFEAIASPLEMAEVETFRPYLDKIGYLAAGGSSSGEKTTAKIIAGVAK